MKVDQMDRWWDTMTVDSMVGPTVEYLAARTADWKGKSWVVPSVVARVDNWVAMMVETWAHRKAASLVDTMVARKAS